MDRYCLPHGAKGIEGGDFALQFGGEKIVFIPKPRTDGQPDPAEAEKHFTFHAGPNSGVIDLHETQTLPDGRSQHRTLFALRRDDLPPLLQDMAPMIPELLGLLRPLRLGWLKRHHIGIARGIDPVSDGDIAAVTVKTKRRKRLSLDQERYRQNIFVPEFLEEVYDFPDGNFSLFHRGREIGIGFKKTDADGNVGLFWIKRRDLLRFGHCWQEKVIDALRRNAIPPEQYPEYSFLRA
jgi:hypothetical protein